MKNSVNLVQDKPAVAHEQCDEKKCATCFENRGCIYEQFASAAISKMEESYLANHAKNTAPALGKRA